MRCRTTVQAAVIAVLSLGVLLPVASAADSETFFLGPDGVPLGSLIGTPNGGEMPNYDRGRDLDPGLLLVRSESGLAEADEARFQHWQASMTGHRLVGYPTLVVWSAAAGFEPEMTGVFTVYLLDCPESAISCKELASKQVTVAPDASATGTWVETEVVLPTIDYEFANGRFLGVRIVVSETSEADMMFAYGYPKYRSRLTVSPDTPLAMTEVAPPPVAAPALPASLERMERLKPHSTVGVEIEEAGGIGSLTPWLATLTASTVLLVLLGVVLVFTLSPHGRRERSRFGSHGSRGRNRTVISS